MNPWLVLRRRALLMAVLASALSWRARARAQSLPAARPAARSRHVGMNLAPIAYWTTEFPFADLVKNSSGWAPRRNGTENGAGKLTFTPDGYPARFEPGQSAALAVAWGRTGYPAGRYVVRWEGEGTLGFPLTEAKVASRAPGRIVLDVAPSEGPIFVSIESTRPENPVRRLRVLWPGTEAADRVEGAQAFNPVFLERMAPFSTLRFMDWGRTNDSPVARWSDRATPDRLTYAEGAGVPVETMIALANALQAAPWICIPNLADDDYVRALAELVKAQLDPRLVATIEYSNEVWNGGFGQGRWALERSRRAGLPTPANFASAWYAERILRIVEIFGDVYGAAQKRRWRAVACGQAAWTRFAEDVLAWKDLAKKVEALAIAPYFNASLDELRTPDAVLAVSPADLLERMRAQIRTQTRAHVAAHARLAARHGLRLDAYEGGTHDTTFSVAADRQGPVTAHVAQAHSSPAMRAVYREYLEAWIESGGELLNHYFDIGPGTQWGFWGALDRVTQDPATAPKYLGLLDAIAAHPLARR